MAFRLTWVRSFSHPNGGSGSRKIPPSMVRAACGVTPASSNRILEIPPATQRSQSTQHPRFPKRIILVRHGESLGNVDENLYAEIPDWKIPLTRRGERQCHKAAQDLYELTRGESIFCYCSPYMRTKESWSIIRSYLQQQGDVNVIGVREEPRIAEQQFGNFQSKYNTVQ